MLCSSLIPDKVPHFNAPIYLQNKSQIGKIDEILGPVNEVYFSVKMEPGMVAASFKKGDKVYVSDQKLLPIERFIPRPKIIGGKVESGFTQGFISGLEYLQSVQSVAGEVEEEVVEEAHHAVGVALEAALEAALEVDVVEEEGVAAANKSLCPDLTAAKCTLVSYGLKFGASRWATKIPDLASHACFVGLNPTTSRFHHARRIPCIRYRLFSPPSERHDTI
ncbi:hypothetical protein RSAG8_00378, partial [Rhizoctonia solani AG-8 WAC10335]